ncbi:MAG: glycosyltransferase family A protein [Patescibacteria group bacterium]|mgnify:FL=1
MKNDKPLISVLISVHNSGHHLSEALKSIKTQSYKNLEILAIDDFSSDNSYEILRKFAKKDKRFKVKRNVKRYGIGITLNRLINRAKGDFIAFMDADDISMPDRLKKQLLFLKSNPQVAAVGTQCYFIGRNDKRLGKSKFPVENQNIYQSPLHGISMQFETLMINKTMLPKDVLKFHTKKNPFIYSDVFLKVLPYGRFANLSGFLHYHRNHPNEYFKDLRRNPASFVKLWIKSMALYNYNAPQKTFRSFFAPIIKTAS